MIELLTESELEDVWLQLRQHGDRGYTEGELVEILGPELTARLLETTRLMRTNDRIN